MKRRFLDYIIITLKGLAMGAADVVPGVSGGTIAFISGIYEELLESIDGLSLDFFKQWKAIGFKKAWTSINGNFLLALFSGVAISIFSLAKIIKWLLANEAVLLWSFFFGLVIASIIYVGKQIKNWNVFFCGSIAIIAMILPGISGAFILLILGAYQTAIDTVTNLLEGITTLNFEIFKEAFIKFLMLALGAIVGIKAFSKILNWMFKNHKNLTLALLTGFMIGSLNKIWPWKEVLSWRMNSHDEKVPLLEKSISPFSFTEDPQILWAVILAIVGFLTIFILERIGSKKIA